MTQDELTVEVASDKHLIYVDEILKTIEEAAKVRGTGIAKRKPEYVAQKIKEAKAVIALQGEKFAGFSYIETWEHKQYVTTSGLIVHPDFRGLGLAKRIKDLTFSLARTRWPHAKIFSLTSGAAVMTMNTQLGYKPVTFAELTSDDTKELAWFICWRDSKNGEKVSADDARLVCIMLEVNLPFGAEWTQMKFDIARALLKEDVLNSTEG